MEVVSEARPAVWRMGRGPVLEAGADREAVRRRVGVYYPWRAGPAAAPDRLERARPGPPGGRAQRGGHSRLEGGDLASGKAMAADLGAWLIFEDESGLKAAQGPYLGIGRPHPVVKTPAAVNRRVPLGTLLCIEPGQRPRLIYRVHDAARVSHAKASPRPAMFHELLDAAHQQVGGPLVVVWDNSNIHISGAMTALIAAQNWLTVYQPRRMPTSSTRSNLSGHT